MKKNDKIIVSIIDHCHHTTINKQFSGRFPLSKTPLNFQKNMVQKTRAKPIQNDAQRSWPIASPV